MILNSVVIKQKSYFLLHFAFKVQQGSDSVDFYRGVRFQVRNYGRTVWHKRFLVKKKIMFDVKRKRRMRVFFCAEKRLRQPLRTWRPDYFADFY